MLIYLSDFFCLLESLWLNEAILFILKDHSQHFFRFRNPFFLYCIMLNEQTNRVYIFYCLCVSVACVHTVLSNCFIGNIIRFHTRILMWQIPEKTITPTCLMFKARSAVLHWLALAIVLWCSQLCSHLTHKTFNMRQTIAKLTFLVSRWSWLELGKHSLCVHLYSSLKLNSHYHKTDIFFSSR